MEALNNFLAGMAVCGCWGAALFFLRYWRDTRDRLFLFFAVGLLLFSMNWIAIVLLHPDAETRHYFYLLRLVAFALIIVGVWDKNRPTR